jgi:hypothetical protein
MLFSLGLLSAKCLLKFRVGFHNVLGFSYEGMRLDITRESNALLVKEGGEGGGEPEERDCEIQSSERDSSHA